MHEPSLEIQEEFFQMFIKPFLSGKEKNIVIDFWLKQGYKAWYLDMQPDDLNRVGFVIKICESLQKNNKKRLGGVLQSILESQYETNVRSEQAEYAIYDVDNKDIEKLFSAKLDLYKMLFENEYRLWATIPFFFSKIHDSKIINFVEVSGGEKYQVLKSSKIHLLWGDLLDLTIGVDNLIRNAGKGHDRWEVDDSNDLLLKNVDPATGKCKNIEKITMDKLDELIKIFRKTLWILQTGTLIFIEKNPQTIHKIGITKKLKYKEIESSAKNFAFNRRLSIEELKFDDEQKNLYIVVKYIPQKIVGAKQEILTAGKWYDVVHKKITSSYENQMLDVLIHTLGLIEERELWNVKVKMLDELGAELGVVEYTADELKKLFQGDKTHKLIPKTGLVPNYEIELIIPLKVPHGMRKSAEEWIEKINPDTIVKRE